MSNVGKLIRLTRQIRGSTLGELATTIGRSQSHLEQIESGNLTGTPETLLALAHQLDIAPDVIRDAYLQDARETALGLWERGEQRRRKDA